MSILRKALKIFPYKTQSWIMDTLAHIYVEFWPPAIDFNRHPLYKLKTPEYMKVLDVIQSGDIILRRYNYYSSGWFIPGRYTHAGVYVGPVEKIYHGMVHMVSPGVTLDTLAAFIACDGIQIWRKKGGVKGEEKNSIRRNALETLKKGIPYDFEFLVKDSEEIRKKNFEHQQDEADSKMYCMEGVVRWYKNVKGVDFKLSEGYGEKLYVPSDACKEGKGFELVIEL